jgi:hypothetical protein
MQHAWEILCIKNLEFLEGTDQLEDLAVDGKIITLEPISVK